MGKTFFTNFIIAETPMQSKFKFEDYQDRFKDHIESLNNLSKEFICHNILFRFVDLETLEHGVIKEQDSIEASLKAEDMVKLSNLIGV